MSDMDTPVTSPAPETVPLTATDIETLRENRGRFTLGYDSADINRVLSVFESARLVCVWDYFDDYGYAGNSDFAGQPLLGSRSSGPYGAGCAVARYGQTWLRVHPDVWRYLSEQDSDVDPTAIPSLLTEEPFEVQNIDDLGGDGFANVAVANHAHEDDEDFDAAE